MSWWVHLVNKNKPVIVPNHEFGGTHVLGGTTNAELNITYNYSPFYYQHIDKELGLQWLEGKKAKDCLSRLKGAVEALGIEQSKDYWKATAGNAGFALLILASWAVENPDAVFMVI